ncbi:FtsX-like permease family protein [Desulforhopalus sp. IMCC35007]|uniref:FtsX-like permease family protein n=1 Tax=Desulforhopalus sp. IMCC35007 TaxID=2569543 RepID=UPI0010AEC2B2|nr:FtsX-like permease family protein [Desulforhopalus sp. IMCC35007]TKB06323.1 FtsX-like permease family protein [Desulforhopalus sp. IMCC35007]
MRILPAFLLLCLLSTLTALVPPPVTADESGVRLRNTVTTLSSFDSRSTGSTGYHKSVTYIKNSLESMGLEPQSYYYELPVRRFLGAELTFKNQQLPLSPLIYNAISPEATDGTIKAPVYYVGKGQLDELDGKKIKGSIVLLDFESGRNWQLLASLGAKAAIYLQKPNSQGKIFFTEKEELTPLQFPCFIMNYEKAEEVFGPLNNQSSPIAESVELTSRCVWEKNLAENIYTVIEGSDPDLKQQLLIVEAFFDNQEFVANNSPGADSASSIATFLELAESFRKNPPKRSILLLATSGHAQTLAGMRDAIWSLNARSKDLRDSKKTLSQELLRQQETQQLLQSLRFPLTKDSTRDKAISLAIRQSINSAVDILSRQLIQLRMDDGGESQKELIAQTANQRFLFRRLGWAESFHNLPEVELDLLQQIVPQAIERTERTIEDIQRQQQTLASAVTFRNTVREYEIAASVSLHLSGHGNGVGAFNKGWLYNLKQSVNRTGIYSIIAQTLEEAAGTLPKSLKISYQDTLRPSHLRTWDSWFFDRPSLGGEVTALAGYLGLTFVTTGDGRQLWGTPGDVVEKVDWPYLLEQFHLVEHLISTLASTDRLHDDKFPSDGFVTVNARTNLLLQGELFANFPASNTTILGYQGLNKYYAMVDQLGYFTIKGLADKKHVLDKLVIEGYRYDPLSGKAIWAIDKKETGKDNYRLKLLRKSMQTDLVMFNCRETTLFDLLEPRSFAFMTKIHLFDGRRDAPPEHFWYSRIDTRNSIISSIYTEPGTMLKLTLSDTVLTNKMILTNSSEDNHSGTGYLVDDYPAIINTTFHAAKDAWTLLTPRINNLETHGIFDKRINDLKNRGMAALALSETGFVHFNYSQAREKAAESLALAARVYVQIEKTQKDVLFGVLFYIALFVPFAFVMERFLFSFANIYKRIVAFSAILILLITIIYNVHPAFELAYSPMVVILAFFIIALSFMVTLIIFFRFEDEMELLQRRASHKRPEEISRWKAFTAAFFLGVSNLRRRRIRTILTCTTLIILTFTIMSFTTIKSNQQQVRLPFQTNAPYQGLLLNKVNRQSLPPQATDILVTSMASISRPAPRVWLESNDPSKPVSIPLKNGSIELDAHGLIGLDANESYVTGLDRLLTSGRWFTDADRTTIILEEQMAANLGLSKGNSQEVELWGSPFTVIGTFNAESFDKTLDLDGEPLTPVIFPEEAAVEMTEEELEAMESGDDLRSFQSRYQHIPAGQIAIIPARTLLAAGGVLKNIAVRPKDPGSIRTIATELTDRFNLAIFTGEKDGVWLYNISDTMNYSGVPNIIIPLLISILIVLNTMISSVYERKGEIAVYTSVGLAPSHVAFLFVAEAMALAVISVVLGYLVAQVSAAILSATSLWAGITVNYSSMAGVAAMILVIMVVLISVIYPSRVAARIAIPDVNRTFKLPKPVDNTITVTLPFLMKFREHDSIGGFIHSYLTSHRDISHGLFSTGPVEVIFSCSTEKEIAEMVHQSQSPHDLNCLHLRTNVWLAPFDFGIMQTADIQFCPAKEGEDFLEIKITLKRQSGESGIWQRINTSFLHEFRKQLLIWRSLDESAHRELEASFQHSIGKNEATGDAILTHAQLGDA